MVSLYEEWRGIVSACALKQGERPVENGGQAIGIGSMQVSAGF